MRYDIALSFGVLMATTTVRDIFASKAALGVHELGGWVRTHRQSKNVSFMEVSDGTYPRGIQIVIEPGLPGYAEVAAKITTGSSVWVKGALVPSPAKGQPFEMKAEKVALVGECDAESYPLQKKGHSLEFLREHLHLRMRSNTFGAVFRIRSAAAMAVHSFFQERGFVYLTSPIITTADCEGAGAMFQVTTLPLDKLPLKEGKPDYVGDFFAERANLTVSGQLEAETFACALSNTYTFGPTFRAENSNTTRHLSEFWMIEPEMAFCDLQGDMALAEAFMKYLIQYVLNHCGPELEFLSKSEWTDKGFLEPLHQVMNAKFAAMDYTEAIKILEKSGKKFEYPVRWGIDMQSEHERFLTDEYVKGPVFVVNYPKEIKAFYMRVNDDGKTVRAMDLLVPRMGEAIGGSQREERLDVLKARLKELGMHEDGLQWYLDLRRYGSVPHAGFGLGFERFLGYVTGMHNIRDVIPFPRFPGYAKF